jgi:hypothetical protein
LGQINLAFTSKNIDPRDHKLSVLIETDSFVYGVFDKNNNLVAAGNHAIDLRSENPLSGIIGNKDINALYYKTLISYSTTEFAHLNELDYDGGNFEAYFNNMSSGDEIARDKFTDSGVYAVFPFNSNLRSNLKDLLSPVSEIHISTAMRQYLYPSQTKKNIVLVGSDRFHYMSYSGGDFTMYNAYTYRTKEDFLYYLQLATDFAGIDREVDTLEIGGWLGEDSDIYKSIEPYYRHIEWVTLPAMKLLSSDERHLKHHYFALYAGVLCVS